VSKYFPEYFSSKYLEFRFSAQNKMAVFTTTKKKKLYYTNTYTPTCPGMHPYKHIHIKFFWER
jgi:hypothetical protein